MAAAGPGPSRTKSKRKSKSAGMSGRVIGLLVVGAVVVIGGIGLYATTRTDASARLAGEQFRSVKPVYATEGNSVVDHKIDIRLTVAKAIKNAEITLYSSSERHPDSMAYRVTKFSLTVSQGASVGNSEKVTVDADGVRISSLRTSLNLDPSEVPSELAELQRLVGPWLARQSMTSDGAGPLTPTNSTHGQTGVELVAPCAFLQPPFAENVDWWDVPRIWQTDGGGKLTGKLRYEKLSSVGDRVTVSVEGSLRAVNEIDLNGIKVSGADMEVEGQQVYSRSMQQWESGKLKLLLDGQGRIDGRTGRLGVTMNVSFDGKISGEPNRLSSTDSDSVDQTSVEVPDDRSANDNLISSQSTMRGDGSEFAPKRFDLSAAEWKIPVPAPKRPVLASSYQPEASESVTRRKSEMMRQLADQMKSEGNYKRAAIAYALAIKEDESNAMAIYQLACCHALWGKADQAIQSFQRAIDAGFDDFPTAFGDDELGAVRQTNNFASQLRTIQSRYLKNAANKVGTPLVTVPTGRPPLEGWPVIFLLHGYGDTNEAYLDLAEIWSDLGFVSVALPGSIPQSSGGFIWSEDTSEVTHQQIQLALTSLPASARVNRKQVHLMGFSQGALHSFQAAKRYPELYRGVVALSPGGSPIEFRSAETDRPPRRKYPLNVWFAYGRQEPLKPVIDLLEEISHVQGWKTKTTIHNGGHTFPDNLVALLPQIAEFIKQ